MEVYSAGFLVMQTNAVVSVGKSKVYYNCYKCGRYSSGNTFCHDCDPPKPNRDELGVRPMGVPIYTRDERNDFQYLQMDVNGRILVKCPTCMKEGALEWKE